MERPVSWRFQVVLVLAWLVLMFLFLPILAAIPVSFTPSRFFQVPGLDELSMKQYVKLFSSEAWLDSIGQSAVIAGLSSLLAVVFGTAAAIGLWHVTSRLGEVVRGLALTPVIVPPVVAALAFYRLCSNLDLFDTYAGMILAHAILGVPFVVITVSASLSSFDVRLEQAARNLGATLGQTLIWVVLPNIRPGVIGGAVFAFIISWDEIIVTLFITSRNIFTLPRQIWSGIRDNVDPAVAAVATVLIGLTFAAVVSHLVVNWRRRREARATSQWG